MIKVIISGVIACTILLASQKSNAQSMLDASVGTSHQDASFINLAYRYQVNKKFRVGFETQVGSVKYRMIDAKVIKEGYTSTFSIPLTMRLYQKDAMRLEFYSKVGARFQGVLDPDNNDKRDSTLNSMALNIEPGLITTISLNKKLNLQSGVTFPVLFQVAPSTLFENMYPALIHLGLNHQLGINKILFVKSAFGSALGGSGDTQKFGKSIQAGLRIALGKKETPNFIEPSF